MSCWRRWGSSSLPYVTLLSPGAGTARWQSHRGGTCHLLGSAGWRSAREQQQAAGQPQCRVGEPRHGLLAATKESSSFQGLCFLSPAFSICQGRPGPVLTLAMKVSRQDVPHPFLPSLSPGSLGDMARSSHAQLQLPWVLTAPALPWGLLPM